MAAFLDALRENLIPPESAVGALKVPHEIEDKEASKRMQDRLKREIGAMASLSHPNVIRLLDHDSSGFRWFVMEYLPLQTLHNHRNAYLGKVEKALRAIRDVVDAVASIHRQGFVHRDIKPKNIFLRSENSLVLADFGIVYTKDDDHTRLTQPGDTIVSRDWIPPWLRFRDDIENYPPSCDLHMLGKVMYSMVSSKPNVDASQLEDPDFDVRKLFPDLPEMEILHRILALTVVTQESKCVQSAEELLKEIDRGIAAFGELRSQQHKKSQPSQRAKVPTGLSAVLEGKELRMVKVSEVHTPDGGPSQGYHLTCPTRLRNTGEVASSAETITLTIRVDRPPHLLSETIAVLEGIQTRGKDFKAMPLLLREGESLLGTAYFKLDQDSADKVGIIPLRSHSDWSITVHDVRGEAISTSGITKVIR